MLSPLRRAALALLLAAPGLAAGGGGEIEISWEKDLAFEWDRDAYERTLREAVRSAEAEVTAWLGMERTAPLRVRVVTKAQYEARFGPRFAALSGAVYGWREIYVNGAARLDGHFAATMVHEMTHAILDDGGNAAALPAWLNEGLAERLGYRRHGEERLTTVQVNRLEDALEHGRLLPLPDRSFGGSAFSYLQSFAAVLFLEQKVGRDELLRVVRRTLREGAFEPALDRELRWTVKDLEGGFRYWVDHLQ